MRKPPRPDRNGSVYAESTVHHSAATSSAVGSRMNSAFKRISHPVFPVTAKPSRNFCESRIHVKGDERNRSASCHVDGIACGIDASM